MGAKILLADDSVTIQKVVELTLSDEDVEITTALDGAAALQKAEEILPDLILADIVMPHINGYELCEKVRQNPALNSIPVLLLSSTFETYDEERGKSVQADDHIIKPFESEELILKVRTFLEKERKTVPAAPEPILETGDSLGSIDTMAPLEAAADVAAPAVASSTHSLDEDDVFESLDLGTESTLAEPEPVESEDFDFELTDDFMEEAEEIFETPDEVSFSELTTDQETEEFLPEEPVQDHTELTAFDLAEPSDTIPSEPLPEQIDSTIPEEIAPEVLESAPMGEEAFQPAASAFTESSPEGFTFSQNEEPSSGINEIDKDLIEEEDVNVYEIPVEYAEGPELDLTPVGVKQEEAAPFQIREDQDDLIDNFMSADENAPVSSYDENVDKELTDAEITNAVEPDTTAATVEPGEFEPAQTHASEKTEEDFEDIFPTESQTNTEWSPELTEYGGTAEVVPKDVVEKPFQDQVAITQEATVTEETVRKIVSELVEKMAAEIIEKVAWEVIPDLAEVMIQKEIQRLQHEVERS